MTQITQGRFTAHISPNGDRLLVILTRDGDCLPGIPSRFYGTPKAADKGARAMIAKASA